MSDYPLPPITVKGGRGGHFAITHDLSVAARILREAADQLRFAGTEMDLAHGFALEAASAALVQVRPSVREAQRAVEDTRYHAGGFNAVAEQINEVSAKLVAVAQAYERAEAGAHQGVSATARAGRVVTDLLGVWAWSARTVWANIATTTPAHWLSRSVVSGGIGGAIRPDGPPSLTGLLNTRTATSLTGTLDSTGGLVGSVYESVLWLLAGGSSVLEKWAGEPIYDGVSVKSEPQEHPQARGVADLVADIEDVYVLGNSGITIDTITHPSGVRSHIINIPGTSDHTLSDGSVWDWPANFTLAREQESDSMRLVRDAIEASGIAPGEPIMLQGHSQGGMVAARIAASDLANTYAFTHVVTYGSPAGRAAVNNNVEYLHVQTKQDVTAGVDGKLDANRPNITYVRADLKEAPDPELYNMSSSIAQAHSTEAYRAVGEAVDASTDPSVVAWRDSAAKFVGGGIASRQRIDPIYATPAPANLSASPPAGQVFGPPAPPPDLKVVAGLREALIKTDDPQSLPAFEPQMCVPPRVLEVTPLNDGFVQQRP